MIPDQDKPVRSKQRAQARGLQDLGRLVNDTDVKLTLAEDHVITAQTGCRNYVLGGEQNHFVIG